MAQVSCNYMNKIETMKIDDLKKPLVFVVDMINGFVKEGALSDTRILHIVEDIKKLLDKVHPSIFICDAHDLDAKEFLTYPTHCIKNTFESQVIDELKPYAKNVFFKNSTNSFFADGMQSFIETNLNQYTDIVIVGCCSDICVLQFALTLNTYMNEKQLVDKQVIVPINMIETFHIEGIHNNMKYNEVACDLMLANNIHIVEMK